MKMHVKNLIKQDKKTDGLPLHCRHYCVVLISILLLVLFYGVFGWTEHAYAEGSRTLYPASYPTAVRAPGKVTERTSTFSRVPLARRIDMSGR